VQFLRRVEGWVSSVHDAQKVYSNATSREISPLHHMRIYFAGFLSRYELIFFC
jgi:hypothetical protein